MTTVDDILASGEYVDRRGRVWHFCKCNYPACGMWHQGHPSRGLEPAQMRLVIERDRHRAECPGLKDCIEHPVPHVVADEDRWRAYSSRRGPYVHQRTLSEALDAAVRLAKEGR